MTDIISDTAAILRDEMVAKFAECGPWSVHIEAVWVERACDERGIALPAWHDNIRTTVRVADTIERTPEFEAVLKAKKEQKEREYRERQRSMREQAAFERRIDA